MKNNFRFVFLMLLVILSTSQIIMAQPNWQWATTAGGSGDDYIYNHSVAVDSLGNTYYTGYFTSTATIAGTTLTATGGAGDKDIFVAKYDKNGVGVWAVNVGGSLADIGRGVGVDQNLNVYVTGYYASSSITFNSTTITNVGSNDIVVFKINANGTPGWIKSFGGASSDASYEIAVSKTGNCYFAGAFTGLGVTFQSTTLSSAGSTDVAVCKLNSSGTLVWAKRGGGTLADAPNEIRIDNSENVYVTGYVQSTATFGGYSGSSAGGMDIFVAKYNSGGSEQWLTLAGGTGQDYGIGLGISSTGSVNVTGFYNTTASFGMMAGSVTAAGGSDIFLTQCNSSGTPQWVHTIGSTGADIGNDLAVDAGDNIYVTGQYIGTVTFGSLPSITSVSGSTDAFLAKYDNSGNALFSVSAGGSSTDQGENVVVDVNNHIFVSGTFSGTATFGTTTKTSAGNVDAFFTRLNVNYTWNGAASSMNTETNWTPHGVPAAADNITITNTGSTPYLTSALTVNKLTMTSGAINGLYDALTVLDSTIISGASIACPIISSGTLASITSTGFTNQYTSNCFTANCDNIYVNGSTFNNTVTITKKGSSANINTGGNIFNGALSVTNSGSGELRMAGTTNDTYNSSVTFTKSGAGNLKVAYAGVHLIAWNITANGGVTFGDGGGTISLTGNRAQTISGNTSLTMPIFIINKPSNFAVTINTSLTVSSALTLTSGKIIMGGSSVFTINSATSVTGGSASCYIDGALAKQGNTAFTFPIGNKGIYMPLTITAPSSSTDVFQAQAFASTPPNSSSFSAPIKSTIQGYWNLTRPVGSSNVQAKLYWTSTTPKPIFPDVAHVVENTSGVWQDKGSNSLTYSYLQGNVTSNTLTTYGYVTLGFTSANPATCSTCDTTMNWTLVRSYDEYGRVTDEKKIFADNLGRIKQSQQRNIVANKILAQANVYDTYGRPALATLAAPIPDTVNFTYHSDFVTNSNSAPYSYKDFDTINKLNNSSVVSTSSPLGKYYSNYNTYESYVATSSRPYSSNDYNDFVIGGVTRSSGSADSLAMGKGHEQRVITLPVYGELDHYYTLKNNYFVSSAGKSLSGEVLKTVTKDENGTEAIAYTNKSGQTIAQCLASSTDSLLVSVTLKPIQYTYTISVPSNTTYTNVLIEIIGEMKLHDNSTGWEEYSFGLFNNTYYRTMKAGQSISLYSNAPFYIRYDSYNSSTGIFNKVRAAGYNFTHATSSVDIHLQQGHHLSITQVGSNTISVVNMETGVITYNGAVSSFSASSVNPGFYRISFLSTIYTGSSNTVTVSYYNKYGNYTYSFYDNAGRLLGQTAPNGVNRASTAKPNFTTTNTYNTLGWRLSTLDPDRGRTYYVYAKDGSLRYYQDSLQRVNNRFAFFNYDSYKRIVQTGEYISIANQTDFYFQDMKSIYNRVSVPSGYSSISMILEGTIFCIGNICYGNDNTSSIYEYDIVDTSVSSFAPGFNQRNVNGKLSASTNNNIFNIYSYDEKGRIEWNIQILEDTISFPSIPDRIKTMEYVYDASDNLVQTIYQRNVSTERFDHFYLYDQMQRLQKVQTSISGGTPTEQAEYQYYLHGPMKRTELGDTLQGLDYVYTINGMLKAINHPYLDSNDVGKDGYSGAHSHFGKDVFGMMLEYYDNDYVRDTKFQSTSNLSSSGYKNYFNGTIRSWSWNQSLSTMAQYAYKYDAKYQLTEANFGTHNTGTNQFTVSASNAYRVYGITYDQNGNINYIRRTDESGVTGNKDFINYVYNTNKNTIQYTRTTYVGTRSYSYDAIGRMVSGVYAYDTTAQYMSYDYTGKVTAVYKDAGKTQALASFLYDEKGYRIRKTQYNSASPYNAVSHTYYVNDMQGTVLSVYHVNVGSAAVQEEVYVYGKSRIAMLNKYDTTGYNYELKDHLGNVRATIRKNTTTHTVEVLSYSDYYPHGGLMPGRHFVSGLNERYNCYQGETAERDDETGLLSFELRMYDPDVARWLVPDPMNQYFSPYLAMGNDPISRTDGTGGEDEGEPSGYNPNISTIMDEVGNPSNKYSGGYAGMAYGYGGWNSVGYGGGEAYGGAGATTRSEDMISIGSGPRTEDMMLQTKSDNVDVDWIKNATALLDNGKDAGDPPTGDHSSPFDVGWEWLTGTGPRHHDFGEGDEFTELLQQHEHIQQTREMIIEELIKNGGKAGTKNQNNYRLGGVGGVGKYLKDYSTLLTGGLTGNLAVTYLGSYGLTYEVIDVSENTATVLFIVTNRSTIESATHPPVIGYTDWWGENIGRPLNETFSSGPLSVTTQTFRWTETIKWK